jgi:hypothetical protein
MENNFTEFHLNSNLYQFQILKGVGKGVNLYFQKEDTLKFCKKKEEMKHHGIQEEKQQ